MYGGVGRASRGSGVDRIALLEAFTGALDHVVCQLDVHAGEDGRSKADR